MSLKDLYKGSNIIEILQNYSLSESTKVGIVERFGGAEEFYDEYHFWRTVIDDPDLLIGKEITLSKFVISKWVARVPGLYWTKHSRTMRLHQENDIAIQSQEWMEFNPPGKSRKVLGGIGTLLLPPSEDGKVLMSVTSSLNASCGIPILLYPQVLDSLKIKDGSSVRIKRARWQPMDIQWSKQFDSTKGLPRGYLIIDNPKKIEVYNNSYPVAYHPFSIMEYEHKDTLLYDFVYVSADNRVENVDLQIENFFEYYRTKEGRNGQYLLNPNIVSPIFEARYMSPQELQRPSEKAKLKLLHERVRGACFNNIAIDRLINELPKFYQSSISIFSLARLIGINPSMLSEDSASSMASQLISLCIEKEKIEHLINRMAFDYPQIFN
ncbi:hypothetical protein [Flavobacterium collinsii]|uniref:Uncharacterized protein n=1 Tax=Flavobacterium collinsii TaxID=1114861 RepID=A0ABM8KM59_9FLAO|nr:hypothetical protein [Flavobacterium collinsii]CAA9200824.1 hypothetical protein FLACOL7796_03450 [Flavobacterium collinsii]